MQDFTDKVRVSEESVGFKENIGYKINQRVHFVGDSRRIGTVKYVGPIEGYQGIWVGVDWDNGEGKHDGSINGVRYFQAKGEKSASFVQPQNLSANITFLKALELRYRGFIVELIIIVITTSRQFQVLEEGKIKDFTDKVRFLKESVGFEENIGYKINQRVHFVGDSRRIGTVKYLGPIEGYPRI
ncbi:tubulin-specific chaperone E-like [Telopea speciosissima]|uniref:tubulin-specific chaperone E-like n=1 Tax=Telopea speciosissima TaxID=54955 RepID=UPI001CC6C378|nr:tubulin-specific chaperone E-like [Telopea speciosissima]